MSVASAASREEALAAITAGERFIVLTHENPDGDALGSLVAMHGLLTALEKECDMYVPESDLPLPREYRWLTLRDRVSLLPDDVAQRTVVFLH